MANGCFLAYDGGQPAALFLFDYFLQCSSIWDLPVICMFD